MLLSGTTRSQSNNLVSVDRDSLYQVFMNYEKVKVEYQGLKLDTTSLREIVRQQDSLAHKLRQAVDNYKEIIIPQYQELSRVYEEKSKAERKESRRRARRRFLQGAGVGGIIVFGIFAFQ